MATNYPPTAVRNQIRDLRDRILFAKDLSVVAGANQELLDVYGKVDNELSKLESTIDANNFSTEYANQLAVDLDKLISAFPRSYGPDRIPITLEEIEKPIFKNQQERDRPAIEEALSHFLPAFDFFTKLDFLSRDMVIVGANGSGKTLLANNLRRHIKDNGIVISAQRVLLLPSFNNIKSQAFTAEKLKRIQLSDKTNKNLDFKNLLVEFASLIQNLLAEDILVNKEFKRKAIENAHHGKAIEPPSETRLETLIALWNSVFDQPQIYVDDDMNIRPQMKNSNSYQAMEMSEGEKVVLFLIAQVLQSPENGFIIIDEPEMYLHPTIHKKLWDKLESKRPDSKFIYFTHDLDFATSRVGAKTLWLRSFTYPDKFIIEEIPTNEIPQPLLLELLGSRQNILFCEGKIGSLDERVYSILFPSYTIKPVESCLSVMSYTKAFNTLPNVATKAIGIIDSDFHSRERMESLESKRVFGIRLAEVENLFFDEVILNRLSKELNLSDDVVPRIKEEVLKELQKEKDRQISNYVSNRVDLYFKDCNVSLANDTPSLRHKLVEYIEKIDLEGWIRERTEQIEKIISEKDYRAAIQIFNNKHLKSIAKRYFDLKDFNEYAIKLIQKEANLQEALRKHFPEFK